MNFPCPYCLGSSKDHFQCRQHALEFQKELVRDFAKRLDSSGVPMIKSIKLYTADDALVCDNCKQLHGRSFPIVKPEEISLAMENNQIKMCKNPICRCYWRPEKISY